VVDPTSTQQVTGQGGTKPESQPESLENRVLHILVTKPASKAEISAQLGQKEVSGHLNKVVRDLLTDKTIEYTLPDKPNSRLQKYRLTERGLTLLADKNTKGLA
jgi:ATP-dependent DNA helicase RecG